MTQSNTTGRYDLGEKLITISLRIQYPGSGSTPARLMHMHSLPSFYEYQNKGVRLHSVVFKELEVTEHHQVPGEWDDNLQYDGYILIDREGQRWTNQYPRACYGQVSDTADRVFYRDIPEDEERDIPSFLKDKAPQTRLFTDLIDAFTPNPEQRRKILEEINQTGDQNLGAAVSHVNTMLLKVFSDFYEKYPSLEIYDKVLFEGTAHDGKPYRITRKALREKQIPLKAAA